ncbi:MAG: bifunctional diaminohydroxyphosphoribosylaminopyrimidine deaminase/5-amino-6-(5-phosphoribosylamino)uracil reductase RibD [Desulfomonile sp.]|nr:bifunctional diaminohydroxyphosphoribosylaminopyrimidine deaminase/5-amino-6-(5-phosphoribosylamino)uracil reductase RibD [Desulfomonile sp.]
MARALRLARRGLGKTDPNPVVGALVVKDGKVVGQGYHKAAGQPHAEIEAIREAGALARDADLFVTLEPCNHHGRTPPCTQAILGAGIKRVWYGTEDPNPDVPGRGADTLRGAGIEVIGPVMEADCRIVNEVYLTHITLRRPFVYLKLAMSLDGKIATRTGMSKWITSEASRMKVHNLRNRVSSLMVGVGTILADDPLLTTRLKGKRGRDPIRVIVDSNLRTPINAAIFNSDSNASVLIGCRKNPPSARVKALERRGARVIPCGEGPHVDLEDLLRRLYELGITSLLIEGGAGLAWGALQARVVDRGLFFYAPIIIGGSEAQSGVGGRGIATLDEAPRLVDVTSSRCGPDILVSGRVAYPEVRDNRPE